MTNLKLNHKSQNGEGNSYIIQGQQKSGKERKFFQNKTLNKILIGSGIAFAILLVICLIILAIPLN